MKRRKLHCRTLIISDVHLGFTDCKITEVNDLLRHTRCDKLILNGDIIDAWHLKKWGKWTKEHTRFWRLVLKKAEKHGTEVIYLRGNHDDFLWKVLPLTFDRIHLVNEHIHEQPDGRKYAVLHGDAFDALTTNARWLSILGTGAYSVLLMINRFYNWTRKLRGKEYFSISQAIKAKVKSAVSAIGRYEDALKQFAADRDCAGIICGHIHTPADKMIDGIHYLNSGDWVESLTGIFEHADGSMELFGYPEFVRRTSHPAMELEEEEDMDLLDDEEPLLAGAAV